ncbi:hypothetical protein T08_14394, partial [Trichinella sp. T8]
LTVQPLINPVRFRTWRDSSEQRTEFRTDRRGEKAVVMNNSQS